MVPVLLILIPLLTGLAAFFFADERKVRSWVLFSSILTLIVSILGLTVLKEEKYLQHQCEWLQTLGSSFSVKLDGMGQLLCLLNAIAYPVVMLATWKSTYKKAQNFFALMLLAQAGMMGVFLAMDALLFYFFWELALIPMYFLCSQWGGEKRIQVTFKFFIYTFIGSLLMLVGILYIWSKSPTHSFDISSFYNVVASPKEQLFLFWLFFIAFAIKMPIFPLHTWQPATYEQAPTATTMILSGVMVKMGVLGLLRWLLPVVPYAAFKWGDTISLLAIVGMIYASMIAIRQDNLKKLVAYSSIAHIGLMCAAVFSETIIGLQGVMIQMFNHGINIIGLWVIVEVLERQFGAKKISELGGIAQKAPVMTLLLVIVALANIALPLTNAFAGEFLMFTGLFNSFHSKYAVFFTVFAGISIILAAVYTLNMIRNVFYGPANELTEKVVDLGLTERIALGIIVVLIFFFGFYPQGLLDETKDISAFILSKAKTLFFEMRTH
jgi:NADH-quinone oxidoreductase subunit M